MADVRLIDANDIEKRLYNGIMFGTVKTFWDVKRRICASPTIDPESLRPAAHWKSSVGEWVHVDDSGEVWSEPAVECSKCGGIISQSDRDSYVWNYCPVCGSKMEDEK